MKPILLCLVLMFLAPVRPALARKPQAVKVHVPEGKITAFSTSSISGQTSQTAETCKISAATSIHLDGRMAGATDLKKGLHAEVTASQPDPGAASASEAANGH